jgi:hypothetical protein
VSLLQFAENAVHEAIMDLDEQKSPGPNGITPSILKKLVSVVQLPLTFLYNVFLFSGVFSAIWKESFIVPIFKTGEKSNISCYRGISILSTIPKLFDTQHGFMKCRSTVTNLMEFSNFVISKIEEGNQVDGVYTDFSKAFDRVNHSLLCFNLSRSQEGSMLRWSESYFTGRTQRLKM